MKINAVSLYTLLAITLLTGCATNLISPKQAGQIPALSFLNTYEAALNDYNKGRIMIARERVLSMDKTREDYPQALKLLKRKVEPARKRLLHHYEQKAKADEKGGHWYKAMTSYAKASELSLKPKRLKKKRYKMELKFRQLRMDHLIAQRRDEDSRLLLWLNAYEAPKGVSGQDDVFNRVREHVQETIEDRANLSYREARRYLDKGLPEIAYIEAESYMRLTSDSRRGKQIISKIKLAIPKGIHIASARKKRAVKPLIAKENLSRRAPVIASVSREKIIALIQKGDWIGARKLAKTYHREGGKDAEGLLKKIESNLKKEAAGYFARGRVAFRKEDLKSAIQFWEKAVEMMPEDSEYIDALLRAQQLQERLQLLQSEGQNQGG